MEKILDYLVNSLENGNIPLAVVVVLVALLFKAKVIYEFFETFMSSEEKLIFEDIKNENVTSDIKEFIIERINTFAFQRATGIFAENPLRSHIIDLHKQRISEISLHDIKLAMPHIKLKNNKLIIELGVMQCIDFYLTRVVAIYTFLYALALMLLPVLANFKPITISIGVYVFAFFLCFLSGIIFRSSLPYWYARKLKPLLEREAQEESQPTAATLTPL